MTEMILRVSKTWAFKGFLITLLIASLFIYQKMKPETGVYVQDVLLDIQSILSTVQPTQGVTDKEHLKILNIMAALKKDKDLRIVINDVEYKPTVGLMLATAYLIRNFKPGDDAQQWAKEHTYRTDEGYIVYFKYPDGKYRPMRDVLLEKLAALETVSPTTNP